MEQRKHRRVPFHVEATARCGDTEVNGYGQ